MFKPITYYVKYKDLLHLPEIVINNQLIILTFNTY